MGILQRIKYEFSSLKKLVMIGVEFELTTKSGHVIHTIDKEMLPPKKMIIKYSDWDYYQYCRTISKDNKKLFNEMAKDILNDFQKKSRKKFNNGLLDSGDYIVKCTWDMSPTFKDLDYTEYKNEMRVAK